MTVNTELISIETPEAIQRAHQILAQGGVVAFPTDTVYGVGVVFSIKEAVLQLYAAKQRPGDRAIPILIASEDMLPVVSTGLNDEALALAEAFWPGPLTLVVPRHPRVPDEVSTYPTVAVRVPNLDFTRRLLEVIGPLAVTSANLSGGESPKTAGEVLADLSGRVELVLDGGRTPGGTASTIVDCSSSPRILREGPVSVDDIQKVLGSA